MSQSASDEAAARKRVERELIDMKVALADAITQWAGLEDNMAQLSQTIIGHFGKGSIRIFARGRLQTVRLTSSFFQVVQQRRPAQIQAVSA